MSGEKGMMVWDRR